MTIRKGFLSGGMRRERAFDVPNLNILLGASLSGYDLDNGFLYGYPRPIGAPTLTGSYDSIYNKFVRRAFLYDSNSANFWVVDADYWLCSYSPMVVPTGFQKWKFSTSGKRLAVGSTGSGIQIYDTATMNLLQTISLSGLDITGLVWGPLDSKLAVSLGSSPFIKVYNFETEAFMSDPATLPAGLTVGCDWSYEHNLLAVGHYNTPFVTIYQMPGFTKITNPSAGLPSGRPVFVKFSPSGRELYVPQTGYDGTRVYICPEFTFLGNAPWGSFDEVSWMEFNTRGSWVVYRYSYSLYLKRYASNGFTAIATLSSSYNKAMFTDHALGA